MAWPPAMPREPLASARIFSISSCAPGLSATSMLGQNLKCERLQRVSRQQRGGFAEFDMTGGLAPAQNVVVHAGQVIVHQGIGMDHFDCGGYDFDSRRIGFGQLARGEGEQRTHAFAAPSTA